MTKPEFVFIGLIGLLLLAVLASLGWRFAVHRISLPCPSWLSWLVEFNNPFFESFNAHTLVQRLDLQPGMRVRDVGCGPGRLTVPVAEQVGPQGEVVSIDIQPGMLCKAQKKAESANLKNIRFLQVGAGEGKLERGQADRALLVTVLGEIPDRAATLKEIYAALKPGGWLSVTEILVDPHYQARGTILRLADAVGFRPKEFYGNRIAFTLILEKPALA